MLCDEHGVAAIGRLAAVVAWLGRREALRDDVGGVRAHRRGATHERDRAIAIAGLQVELCAKPLAAELIEVLIEGAAIDHARG